MMEEKEKILIEAARQVFGQKGYKKTSVADITNHAGVAVGSFYKYYASKEDIFIKVYLQENEAVRDQIIHQVDWQDQPEGILENLWEQIEEKVVENRILAEWFQPDMGPKIRQYYMSDEGKSSYNFHLFLVKLYEEKLHELFDDSEKIKQLLEVYDLIFDMDCLMNDQYQNYIHPFRTMIKYFVRGVLASSEKSLSSSNKKNLS